MDKRRYILACFAAICLAMFGAGCKKDNKAVEMYRDGVWELRYVSSFASGSGEKNESAQMALSVNVKKEMTKEEMWEVVDYYNARATSFYDTGDGVDCACYAVFFQGDADEELFRMKSLNGKEAEPAKEDNSIFPMPGMRGGIEGWLP